MNLDELIETLNNNCENKNIPDFLKWDVKSIGEEFHRKYCRYNNFTKSLCNNCKNTLNLHYTKQYCSTGLLFEYIQKLEKRLYHLEQKIGLY
jgi:hypothetical protein